MCKRYVQNITHLRITKILLHESKAYKKTLMVDLKLAIKNCIESVEKTHATENIIHTILSISA